MVIETEGIVLRQRKALGGRRMIVILTEKYGKISAGTSISEKTKTKAALALRPFTLSMFQIFKNRDNYNIASGEAKKSYFSIGEDIDKYILSCHILELTDKVVDEGTKQREIFVLLTQFLDEILNRKESFETLGIAYKIKVLKILGYMPNLTTCGKCDKEKEGVYFSVKDGGIICQDCIENYNEELAKSTLIFHTKFDIVNIILFFEKENLKGFRNLKLDKKITDELEMILKEYYKYHLGVLPLKSEDMINM